MARRSVSVSPPQKREGRKRLDTTLVEILWSNRPEAYFSAHPTTSRTAPLSLDRALDGLASGWSYFAPVPRKALGNRAYHCADTFDAIWVDIDRDPSRDPDDLGTELLSQLPEPLVPTAMVYSGRRGLHAYWKLDDELPISELESYNRNLAHLVGGDHCHARTQLLRNPGTPHPITGKLARILSLSGEIHPISRLALLGTPEPRDALDQFRRDAEASLLGKEKGAPSWLQASSELKGWGTPGKVGLDLLTTWQRSYLRACPKKGWTRGSMTRSEAEASIVHRLVGKAAGASDEQVRSLADEYFAKHREVKPAQGNAYIDRTINSARRDLFEKGWLTSPLGGWPRKREANQRKATVDDLEELLGLAHGQTRADWVRRVVDRGWSRSSAYRYAAGMEGCGLVDWQSNRRSPTSALSGSQRD